MFCKVLNCRYPETHITKGHFCVICKKYGHGRIECKNNTLKSRLKEDKQKLPKIIHCTVDYCAFKSFHTFEGHFCDACRNYQLDCTCNNYRIPCPICRTINFLNNPFTSNSIYNIYGLEEKCKICMEEIINVRLLCGHCLCKNCILKLNH